MKILIVDDKEEDLYLLETLLKGSGYEVVSAKNGVETLEMLQKQSVDMIISDILMPKMDGYQLCRQCKSDDTLRKIAFVFYTATYTDKKDEEFALSLGAEKFIVKPTDPEVFLKILKSVIKEYSKGLLVAPKRPVEEEIVCLAMYNKRLIEKLEKKMLDMEREITERKKAEGKLLDYQKRLKSMASQSLLAEERERQRLAVGLHDQIGQNLALTKVSLQSLRESLSDSEFVAPLDNICAALDRAIEDANSLVFELGNPVLYELGFETAVRQFLSEQVESKYGIKCKLTVDSKGLQLDNKTTIILFRVVRELLTNVVKHAKAKNAEVRIKMAGDKVEVAVEDDGVGFLLSESAPSLSRGKMACFGLFSIQEQLEYLGGGLNIKSELGKGTCITVTIPLKQETTI